MPDNNKIIGIDFPFQEKKGRNEDENLRKNAPFRRMSKEKNSWQQHRINRQKED
ncbi:hypothetical protein VU04_09525 [Desulfobulbus sp. TB]|nr:hypothetical protein [Desulfobulbus sp. TB]